MSTTFILQEPQPTKVISYTCGNCPYLVTDSGLSVNFNRCAAWKLDLSTTLYSAKPGPHPICLTYLAQKEN